VCRLEAEERLVVTPFEKNLEVWRQLWRVLERSDFLVQVVDARNPLFYASDDLEAYARCAPDCCLSIVSVDSNVGVCSPLRVRMKTLQA
jgi:ribosome biogenesis GTPase A